MVLNIKHVKIPKILKRLEILTNIFKTMLNIFKKTKHTLAHIQNIKHLFESLLKHMF